MFIYVCVCCVCVCICIYMEHWFSVYLLQFCLFFLHSCVLDIKADDRNTCTLPEMVAPVPQEIDPTKENRILFTYSVHWEVRHVAASIKNTACALLILVRLIKGCSVLHCRRAR